MWTCKSNIPQQNLQVTRLPKHYIASIENFEHYWYTLPHWHPWLYRISTQGHFQPFFYVRREKKYSTGNHINMSANYSSSVVMLSSAITTTPLSTTDRLSVRITRQLDSYIQQTIILMQTLEQSRPENEIMSATEKLCLLDDTLQLLVNECMLIFFLILNICRNFQILLHKKVNECIFWIIIHD